MQNIDIPVPNAPTSPSSSEDDLEMTVSAYPSSIGSQKSNKSATETDIQLPRPFFPPSLVQSDPKYGVQSCIPPELPPHLHLPKLPSQKACSEIDSTDVGTPDEWIPRDRGLVRLTGKHPFNAEAKLGDLYTQGFITPSNLFFVRNHGAVPKISQEDANNWKLKIHGLCANPVVLTLADLHTKFRVVTLPVTLVCAGNRRKEQNIVQKSLGFSWGAGGVSTALFTGIYLADVLEYARPTRSAKHVIFEGCDDLPNGPYGTSQLLNWARDRQKGMMLAWGMNGLALEPDHGYPLRLVVPSQIGGRSVKWLTRIELSATESQHHLHFHDNKVLPMPLGPEQARKEQEWWYDSRYMIRELSVNSAIACPDHNEVLDTTTASATYTVQGYAYAGGGRRVTRVELSTDSGATWNLTSINYPEDAFRSAGYTSDPIYGAVDMSDTEMCYCWCFWSYEMPVKRLQGSKAIIVRAMDESMAVQPRDMYWNATGMMNNWWFRVCIHQLEGGELKFEHPTMAGTQKGGWMQRLKDEGLDPATPDNRTNASTPNKENDIRADIRSSKEVLMTRPGISRRITTSDMASVLAREQAWFVVQGEVGVSCSSEDMLWDKAPLQQVYNGSGFFKDHPGGAHSIQLVAGEDATEDFLAIHSFDAQKQLAEFHIGTFQADHTTSEGHIATAIEDVDHATPFLHAKRWKTVKLAHVRDISKDTKIFRFALSDAGQGLGLPIGNHIYVRLKRKGSGTEEKQNNFIQRAYTPLLEQRDMGFMDLLVKIYYPTADFPDGGRMTQGFAELDVGDCVEIKGPIGHFTWKGQDLVSLHDEERRITEVGLVCAGTGIAPIIQLLRAILHESSASPDKKSPRMWLLDVNRDLDDILFREEIDEMAKMNGEQFRVHYSLTGKIIPEGWQYSTGRITDEMLRVHLPAPGEGKLVCICGPYAMEQSVKASLSRVGWDDSTQVVLF